MAEDMKFNHHAGAPCLFGFSPLQTGPLCVAQADLELDGDLPSSCVTMLSQLLARFSALW